MRQGCGTDVIFPHICMTQTYHDKQTQVQAGYVTGDLPRAPAPCAIPAPLSLSNPRVIARILIRNLIRATSFLRKSNLVFICL